MNSYSNEFKSHMEDFVLIMIILQKSDKGFGSGKKHELDIWTWCNIKSSMTFELIRI